MTKKILIPAALVGLVLVVAAALWHQTEPASAQLGGADGTFRVVASEKDFVLCEAGDGNCWILVRSAKGEKFAWAPIKRLDTESQVTNWRLRNPN